MLCVDEFKRLSQKIPFKTYPMGREKDLGEDGVETQFLLTPSEWETHKEDLNGLTQAVYKAWQARNIELWVRRAGERGVSEPFTAARDMFRENWHNPTEVPHRYGLDLKFRESDTGEAYARIGPDTEKVWLVFYSRAVAFCVDEFKRLSQIIPFKTYPVGREKDLGEDSVEAQFLLDPSEWEIHKEELNGLTQAVYKAWQRQHEDSA